MHFKQKSSLLKIVKVAAAFFVFALLLEFAVFFITSRNYLLGLTQVNDGNGLFATTAVIADGLSSASEALEKTKNTHLTRELKSAFHTAIRQTKTAILDGTKRAEPYPKIQNNFRILQDSMDQYEKSAIDAFGKTFGNQFFRLATTKLELDTREILRALQIEIKIQNDTTFRSVYENRFRPLILDAALTIGLAVLVLLITTVLVRRLSRSIGHLIEATDAVASGDFNYRAKIFQADELGRLAHEFNLMVAKTHKALQRTTSLQNITAAFSESLSPEEVSDVMLGQGLSALGASGAMIYSISESGDRLELQRASGYTESFPDEWRNYSLDAASPISDAVRSHKAIWIETTGEIVTRYPEIYTEVKYQPGAIVAVPLVAHGKTVGGIGIRFSAPTEFDEDDQRFILALAFQAAQALQRSTLYRQAEEAVKARDEFLSVASHELKTPLTSLKMQLQLTQRTLNPELGLFPTPERLDKFLKNYSLQINRLVSLVEDLLDVSKVQAGKLRLNIEKVLLNDLVSDVLERFEPEFHEKNIAYRVEAEENVYAECDRFRMDQVLVNLISNALKYGENKPLLLTLKKGKNVVTFSILDQGIGISPELHTKIFERFERAAPGRNISGLGLGLYITKQIIEAQNGKIRVDSNLSEGSMFTVEMPSHQPTA